MFVILFFKANQANLFGAPSPVKGHTRAGRFIAPYTAIRHHALKKPHHALSGDLLVHDQGQDQPAAHIKTEAVKVSETIKKPAPRVATGTNDSGGQGDGGNGGGGDDEREASRQYAAVVARYTLPDGTKAPGWLKAPNGQPTNLNERQWIQVRTPNFKQWFGEWEAVAKRDALDAMPAIQLDDAALARLEGKALRDEVTRRYAAMKSEPVVTMDGRTVRFTRVGLREIKQHSANRAVLDLLAKADQVLKQAIPLWSLDHPPKSIGDSIRAWHYYGAKISLNGNDFFARMVLREDVNGNIYYDNDLSSVEKGSGRAVDASRSKTGAAVVSADDHSLGAWYRSVNPDAISKVVDANGEPLLVYHGSARKGESANLTDFKVPAYFSESPMEGSAYTGTAAFERMMTLYENTKNGIIRTKRGLKSAERSLTNKKILDQYFGGGMTGGLFQVFLNIRKPKYLHWTDGNRFSMERLGNELDARQRMQELIKFGFDGIETLSDEGMAAMGIYAKRIEIKQWVAFSPTQIKSAIGNTGEFSPTNPEILKAFPFPPHARILFFKAA